MALVLLPCDLPTWPTLQRHLNAMKREVRTAVQLKDALLKIYNLCNTSLEPDEESLGDQRVFDVLCDEVVDTWLSDDERHDLFDSQLPTMVDYALQLKTLKPLRGLHFSLQQQSFACFPYPSIVSLLCCCTTTKQNQKTNAHHESEIKINVTRRRRQPSAGQPGSLLSVYGHQQSLDMYNITAAELNEILFRRCVQDWLKPFTKLTDWQTSKPATEKTRTKAKK